MKMKEETKRRYSEVLAMCQILIDQTSIKLLIKDPLQKPTKSDWLQHELT